MVEDHPQLAHHPVQTASLLEPAVATGINQLHAGVEVLVERLLADPNALVALLVPADVHLPGSFGVPEQVPDDVSLARPVRTSPVLVPAEVDQAGDDDVLAGVVAHDAHTGVHQPVDQCVVEVDVLAVAAEQDASVVAEDDRVLELRRQEPLDQCAMQLVVAHVQRREVQL